MEDSKDCEQFYLAANKIRLIYYIQSRFSRSQPVYFSHYQIILHYNTKT
jgi:hypothetical protein